MRLIRLRASDAAVRRMLWIAGAGGIVFTLILMRQLGGQALLARLVSLGPALPLVLLLTGLRYPLQTAGWRLALRADERPPWPQAIAATVAGSAVSYLTIAGPVAGEPARAMLLRRHTAVATGIAAGALERTLYALTGSMVALGGVAFAAATLGHGRYLKIAMWTAAALAAVIVAGRMMRGTPVAASEPEGPWCSSKTWRRTVCDLWRTRRGALAAIVLTDAAQHALLLTEAWVILHALGVPASLSTVLVCESAIKMTNSVGTFVPGGFGVSEAGTALAAAGLGLGADVGLALALVRRARALAWAAPGLAILGASGIVRSRSLTVAS